MSDSRTHRRCRDAKYRCSFSDSEKVSMKFYLHLMIYIGRPALRMHRENAQFRARLKRNKTKTPKIAKIAKTHKTTG